jgi:hypothetical protein
MFRHKLEDVFQECGWRDALIRICGLTVSHEHAFDLAQLFFIGTGHCRILRGIKHQIASARDRRNGSNIMSLLGRGGE